MMTAVSPQVRERLSVVMVRVTLHEVSPNAMAIAVAMDMTRYLMAFLRRSFCISVNCFIGFWCLVVGNISLYPCKSVRFVGHIFPLIALIHTDIPCFCANP